MPAGDVTLESHITEIAAGAADKAHALVEKTVHDIEAAAKARLIANHSIDTSALVNSGEAEVDGFEGAVGFGTDHSHFIEFGTGERGAASEFPGKPADLSYTIGGRWETRAHLIDSVEAGAVVEETTFNESWKGMAARPYLIPSVEDAREAFELAAGQLYG